MAHSDDDGLVLPPKLAPLHVVVMPIYRDDQTRADVLEYCRSLKAELGAVQYEGQPVRVDIDDRDLRGGEKKWYHVKRGVPIRVEVGPKDIANNAVFVGRRDTGANAGMPRAEFVGKVASILTEIQDGLLERAKAMREANTVTITNEADFRSYFGTESEESTKIFGGFAKCHFASEQAVEKLLQELKVTIRCIPLEGGRTPGKCFLTGQPSQEQAIFARSY